MLHHWRVELVALAGRPTPDRCHSKQARQLRCGRRCEKDGERFRNMEDAERYENWAWEKGRISGTNMCYSLYPDTFLPTFTQNTILTNLGLENSSIPCSCSDVERL